MPGGKTMVLIPGRFSGTSAGVVWPSLVGRPFLFPANVSVPDSALPTSGGLTGQRGAGLAG